MIMKIIILLIFGWLFGCEQKHGDQDFGNWAEISGRNEENTLKRDLIYRVKVPKNWVQNKPPADVSLFDTTKALDEFYIPENKQTIRITIHNFPSNRIDDRISPESQITRWKKQFHQLDKNESYATPQAFNGYCGYLFKGVGIIDQQPTMILGWSMQILTEHYNILSSPSPKNKQMRADFTIKAVGPQDMMHKYYLEIVKFAHSFELIDDIPSRR